MHHYEITTSRRLVYCMHGSITEFRRRLVPVPATCLSPYRCWRAVTSTVTSYSMYNWQLALHLRRWHIRRILLLTPQFTCSRVTVSRCQAVTLYHSVSACWPRARSELSPSGLRQPRRFRLTATLESPPTGVKHDSYICHRQATLRPPAAPSRPLPLFPVPSSLSPRQIPPLLSLEKDQRLGRIPTEAIPSAVCSAQLWQRRPSYPKPSRTTRCTSRRFRRRVCVHWRQRWEPGPRRGDWGTVRVEIGPGRARCFPRRASTNR